MSFLAQLRQKQNPIATGGLQLCYLLSWQDDALHLAMHLAHLENGRVRELDQAYAAQQAHLNQPPSFTIPADVAVLRHLLAGDWGGRAAGGCRDADVAFLRLLLATEKCFFSLADKALSWGEPCAVRPVWRISAEGAQSLSWRHASAGGFWPLAGGDIGVVVEGDQLRPCRSGLTPEALAEVGGAGVLQPENLAEFMEATAPRWRALGLPLPTELPSITIAANVRPVLVCESSVQTNGRWVDGLVLAFRYESEAICFTRRLAEAGSASSFWNGEQLLVVALRGG